MIHSLHPRPPAMGVDLGGFCDELGPCPAERAEVRSVGTQYRASKPRFRVHHSVISNAKEELPDPLSMDTGSIHRCFVIGIVFAEKECRFGALRNGMAI